MYISKSTVIFRLLNKYICGGRNGTNLIFNLKRTLHPTVYYNLTSPQIIYFVDDHAHQSLYSTTYFISI